VSFNDVTRYHCRSQVPEDLRQSREQPARRAVVKPLTTVAVVVSISAAASRNIHPGDALISQGAASPGVWKSSSVETPAHFGGRNMGLEQEAFSAG